MFKKYISFTLLTFILIIVPFKVNALNETYPISRVGSYGNLLAEAEWVEEGGSDYYWPNEAPSQGCDYNDRQYWYFRPYAIVTIDPSSASTGGTSKGQTVTGCDRITVYGKNNYEITKNAIGNTLSCKVRGQSTRVNIKISRGNISIISVNFGDRKPTKEDEANGHGYWANQLVNDYYSQTKYYKIKCSSGSGSTETGVKDLPQLEFKANGLNAYCISPGLPFIYQQYNKTIMDLSNCTNSKNGYHCALAAAVKQFKSSGNSDNMAIQIALRLIAAKFGYGEKLWDGSKVYSASVFTNTVLAIEDKGYSGSSSSPGKGVLYANGNALTSLQSAINVYKTVVVNGVDMWAPSVETLSASYSSGTVTAIIKTNFDSSTTIKHMLTSGGQTVSFTSETCPSGNDSGGCYKVTFSSSSDPTTSKECSKTKIKIAYTHNGDEAISKVGLYQASGIYQDMVVYDKDSETYAEVSLCPDGGTKPNQCRYANGKYYGKDGREVDEETYAKECTTTCPNTKIEYNMPKDCEDDGTSGTISDPTMCTIMNSISSVKNSYKKDYGNEYCTVYCRESLKFTFMDKETAIAGRYFNHNVESYKTNKQYFSTVILSTRQCSSIIDYDKWKNAYDSANQNVLNTWNQLKKIEAQVKSTKSSESKKDCSGGSESACKHDCNDDILIKDSNGIEIGRDHSVKKLPGTYCNPTTITCTSYDWSGARYRHTYSNGSIGIINVGGSDTCSLSCDITCSGCNNSVSTASAPSYGGESGAYNNAVSTRNSLVNKINSCNFVEGSDAYNKVMDYNPKNTISIYYAENFEYNQRYDINIKNDSTSNEVVKRTYANSSAWSSFCGKDCNGNLSNLSGSSNNVTLTYWDCSGSETSAICSNTGVNVPQNRLANIEVERETQHYQSNEFYVQAFTGLVSTKKFNTGFWLSLKDNDKHLYPVSSARRSGNYGIKVTYSDLGDPKSTRKMANGNYTCSYDVVNELTIYDCDDNYDDHTCKCLDGTDCSKNVDGQVGMGVYYRPISLNDVFPHSSYSPTVGGTINVNTRNIGENWTTAKAVKVVKEIQSSGDNLIVDKKPQYVVKLTPSIMKKIRSYNDNTTYLDNSIYKCDNNLICYSSFLDKDLKNIMGSSNYRNLYSKDSSIKSDSLFYYINK